MYDRRLKHRIKYLCKAVQRDQERINAEKPLDARMGVYAKL